MSKIQGFISLCFILDKGLNDRNFATIKEFYSKLKLGFDFFEILVVCNETEVETNKKLIEHLEHTRLLVTGNDVKKNLYRGIAAEEFIGDVILFVDPDEVSSDILKKVSSLKDMNAMFFEAKARFPFNILNSIFILPASKFSGFRFSLTTLRTALFSRNFISPLYDHPDAVLLLRLPKHDSPLSLEQISLSASAKRAITLGLHNLPVLSALFMKFSRTLLIVSVIFSMVLVPLSFCLFAYSLYQFFFNPNITEGWLSVYTTLSVLTLFYSLTTLGISVGLLSQTSVRSAKPQIIREIGRVDAFNSFIKKVNVEK